jgi:hypothetical protein
MLGELSQSLSKQGGHLEGSKDRLEVITVDRCLCMNGVKCRSATRYKLERRAVGGRVDRPVS